MTIKGLLNSCNSSPDIFIQVFHNGSEREFIYEGKYEDIPQEHLSKKVSYFAAEEIGSTYRTYITKMRIYTVPDDQWTASDT